MMTKPIRIKNLLWLPLQLLLAAVFIVGCNGGGGAPGVTSIAAPTNNAALRDYPAEFIVNYAGPASAQVIKLNDITVSKFFTFENGVAKASGSDLKDFFKQGANKFSANTALINFTLDNKGPLVLIESVSNDSPYLVKGLVLDPAGAKSLQINNVDASVTGDSFEVTVDQAAIYQVLATDNLDQTSRVKYAAPGTNMRDAIKVQIDQSAIQTLAQPITAALKNINLNQEELDRILNNEAVATITDIRVSLTCKLIARVYLNRLSIGGIDVSRLDVLEGGKLGTDVRVDDISTDVTVTIEKDGFCILPYPPSTVGADLNSFSTSTDIALATSNGQVNAAINIQDYQITGLNTRFSGILAVFKAFDIFGLIDNLAERIANGMSPAISRIASALINQELSKRMTELVVEAQIKVNNEQGLAFKTQLMELNSNPGKLNVVLSGRLRADPVDAGVPNVLGSLYVGGPVPAPEVTQGNLAVLLGGDFISQALTSAYRAGFFNITMMQKENINQYDLLFGTENQNATTGTEGKLRVKVSPLSGVPIFNFYGSKIAAANVNVHRMQVEVEKYINGQYTELFSVILDFDAGIELAVTTDRKINLNIVRDPVATLSSLNILNNSIDTTFVNNIIGFVMPIIMNQVDRSLLSIELPTIAGYGIRPLRIETLGTQHENLLFEGYLFGPGS